MRKKREAQKKPLVEKAQRTIGDPICVGKKRRMCEGKRQKEEQGSQGEKSSGKIWKMALPSLDFDAELVLCRCCSRKGGARRRSGGAVDHYRVGCGEMKRWRSLNRSEIDLCWKNLAERMEEENTKSKRARKGPSKAEVTPGNEKECAEARHIKLEGAEKIAGREFSPCLENTIHSVCKASRRRDEEER